MSGYGGERRLSIDGTSAMETESAGLVPSARGHRLSVLGTRPLHAVDPSLARFRVDRNGIRMESQHGAPSCCGRDDEY
jgi:hypothetical protein